MRTIQESRHINRLMEEFPKKLLSYLNTLGQTERDEKVKLFRLLVEKAQINKFQSPRFWAMRQVLSGRSVSQIERIIKKRVAEKPERPGKD